VEKILLKLSKNKKKKKKIKQDKSHDEDEKRAKTVVRDTKTGRKLTEEEIEEKKKAKKNPINGNEEIKNMEWGKGLVQNRMEEASKLELELETAAPFARYKNDAKLDAAYRQKERWGDPMMASIKREAAKAKRAASGNVSDDDSDNEKSKKKKKKNKEQKEERDNSLSVAPLVADRPMFRGDPWPNRFGILPGYRWDGRNRSNGWEEKLFTTVNTKKASTTAAHQWSTEDM